MTAVALVLSLPSLLPAQTALSIADAIRMALDQNPALRASEAAEGAAAERMPQARAGFLPTIDYSESVQYGNNPVYVFGSLLEQHRFQASNFDLARLNRPDPLTNFSSRVSVEQTVFDGNRTRDAMRQARAGLGMTREQTRQLRTEVLEAVAEAYYAAVLAQENQRVSEQSLATAEADLQRAVTLREAGMATDADALSLRVARAEAQERLIRAENDLANAHARLNDLLGEPLAAQYSLSSPLRPAAPVHSELAEFERQSLAERPEALQAGLAITQAEAGESIARAAFLPEIKVQGAFAANRQGFAARGGTDWMTGATLHWNLFRGSADRARLSEARFLKVQREQELRRVSSGLQLQVRQAYLSLQAANRRMDVGEAAIAQAEEDHRITANRYEAGLANATELLRSQTALSEARTRYLAAVFDQRVNTVRLARAAGTLSPLSEAVQP
jgi:outer membrane protein TolC